ncbi:MAG: hypothetical protein E6G50_05580 [Actinobacteria bacterium]|nr:MAG: hypothetical protein E6G50_05580 [Actinomycetota bacterium]
MTRSGLGVVSLLVALALGGLLWAMNANQSGPSSAAAQRVETQAQQVSATANFGQAAIQLQTFYAENGTYVGAVLPASFGATLVRADASSYCLQMGRGTALQHLVGPGGQPAPGGC